MLVRQGVDVNLRDASGATALHAAAWHGQIEALRRLLAHKADPALADDLGQTALDLALSAGHEQVVEILAAGQAAYGATGLHRAAAAGSLTLLKTLLATGQDASAADDSGRTPLHLAASRGHLQVVHALLAAKAKINSPDKSGLTPLHAAVRANHADCAAALLEAGADINAADASGRTALHYAAALADPELVRLLLDKGAAADRPGPDATPAQIALNWGNLDAYDLLEH
jgi:ankyrin repeat protein